MAPRKKKTKHQPLNPKRLTAEGYRHQVKKAQGKILRPFAPNPQ